jgi:hypothetical protein
MEAQFAEHKTEPNSGLGKAFSYLNHWTKLTLFLREPGAPIDNNICQAGPEGGHPESPERAFLQDAARSRRGRSLHESPVN